MLTGDENIVDITFQVVWNVRDPAQFLFNLSDPQSTIQAVAESAMRGWCRAPSSARSSTATAASSARRSRS